MILVELLGIDAAPNRSKYHRTGHLTGRPQEFKIKPRPKKNLWFKDQNLWHNDLYSTQDGGFDMVSSAEEEEIIACNKDRSMAYGKWNKKKNMGITYKNPIPFGVATNPNKRFKDFISNKGTQ